MRLKDLFKGIADINIGRFGDVEVLAVTDDSRKVTPGSLFAALSGPKLKGEDFIVPAVKQGARIVLVSLGTPASYEVQSPDVIFLRVKDPRAAFGAAVANFYGRPSDKVRSIGITGTNGKTTVTYFIEAVLAAAGHASGVVGTVNCRIGNKVFPTRNTTPGLLDNQIFLASLIKQGVNYAVMEVSSHALDQGRVEQITFRGGVFTNLTGDHLDYHKTMDKYFEAKSLLFKKLDRKAYAVLNVDDLYGQRLVEMTPARVITYGMSSAANVRGVVEEFSLAGSRLSIYFFDEKIEVKTCFIGKHNIYNILAAFAVGLGEGLAPEDICRGIESLRHVPGRLERVDGGQDFFVFIDYAHTDDGLRNVLQGLKAVPHARIITVFGCGGDRDKSKRPRMGKVACELSDVSIVTSDNPRSEDPKTIINEVIAGFDKPTYEVVVDREEAIACALSLAQKDDVVLLAGKGHETCQTFKDRTIDFIERDIVVRLLQEKGKGA